MVYFNVISFIALLLINEAVGAEVRLVGGRTPYEGRLEVRKSSEEAWGTVCDDGFDNNDARVVCRMLGFHNPESSSVVETSAYGFGSGKIMLDEMQCIGNETDVSQCDANDWGESDCAHNEDISISCKTPTRLVEGRNSHSGIIEIERNGSWESFCFDGFNATVGKVICRMLALSTGDVHVKSAGSPGNISSKIPTCVGNEKDISLCPVVEGSCTSARRASIDCRTKVQLLGGPNQQLGRVEVYYQDKWGTVCDDSFDDNAASVICRMLGYNPKGARARGRAFYGRGTGDVTIDELRCTGVETDISECKSNYWGSHTNCEHNEDASVECGTEIRLVDGPTRFSGRLEIKSRSSWNSMCDDSFDNKTAAVVCRMLGFERGNISIHNNAFYGKGTVTNYSLQCFGNETDIVNCKHTNINSCNDGSDVGVNCYSVTPVRLQGGPTRYSGRVEVYMQELSSWIGICDDKYGFTVDDARVLCRMIGKPNMNPSFHTATNLYDYVIRGKAISEMNCTGSEQDITDCRSGQRWLDTSCGYPNYVGINCEPVSKIRLVDGPSAKAGRVEIQYNGTWGTICMNGFDTNDSDVVCNMLGYTQKSYLLKSEEYTQGNITTIITNAQCKGNERDISDCRADHWMSGSCLSGVDVGIACNSTVRLVNGTSKRSGRVEILHKQLWWTICSDAFDENVADVVCRMAGFRFWNASVLLGSLFGTGTGNILINKITCNGSEPDIAACTSSPWENAKCNSNLVATVDCKIQHTPIRLVDGDTIYSGRVQVFNNNKWGTICAYPFSKVNAEIICWSLGYNFTSDITYSYYKYKSEYNNVMISNMACTGTETDISVCPSDDWDIGSGNCSSTSYHSVGIDCLTPIRLQAGRTEAMGRVEIQHQGSWGTICKDNFVEENVPVICSMLGLNYTKKFATEHKSFHSANIPNTVIEDLQCSGNERDVQQCQSPPWKWTSNCSSKASVNCNTPVRLSEGENWRSGRAELFFKEQWTDVCHRDNKTSRIISNVICKMIGLSTGKIKIYSKTGKSLTAADIACDGQEKDISRCNITIRSCPKPSRLGIKCETNIKLINGRTDYMGGVSLHKDERWEIIRLINDSRAADVICQMLGYNFTRDTTVQTRKELRDYDTCYYTTLDRLNCDGNEKDIFDCEDNYWKDNSYSCNDLYSGVNCQTPVRLTNGSHYQFGELEIRENGTWYPVCSKDFNLQNAHVVCRMLGHHHVRNTTVLLESKRGHEQFVTGDIRCNGSEVDISQCPKSWTKTPCINGGVVSLDCRSTIRLIDGPTKYRGRVEVFYEGKWGNICWYNSRTSNNAKVMCKMLGYNYAGATVHSGQSYSNKSTSNGNSTINNLNCVGTEDDITECPADEWGSGAKCIYNMPLEIECNTPVYLQSGSNHNIGYVHVNYNSTGRSICGDHFTLNEADVICRKIGTETYQNATIYYGNKYGSHYTPINHLQCDGDETDLQECKSLPWYDTSSSCNISNTDVSVNCRPHTPIRINGSDGSGLVEINYRNVWGTICYYDFDIKDASVLCNMLGFKIGNIGIPIDTKQNDVIIRRLQCDGTESDVSECASYYNWVSGYYSCPGSTLRDKQKATVQCSESVSQYERLDLTAINIFRGVDSMSSNRDHSASYQMAKLPQHSDDRVRLVGGVNDYQGRVEFQYIGIWGTVCDENFDLHDAEVVCRQIGFNSEKNAILYNSTRFGYSYTSLVVDDLKCNGRENDLDECASFPWSASPYKCAHSHRNAGVNCRPRTPARLVNNTSKYSGRVEIEYKGSNGTICDRGFDENDAKVICRMLGFNTLSTAVKKHAYFGQGSGKISISDLQCNGDEQDISECRTEYNRRWDSPYEYCTHGHDVSVQCNTPVRLRGGWTYYDGIAEIYINRSWTSVCYNRFTQNDAQTICKLTGLSETVRPHNVTIFKGSYFGMEGSPTIEHLGCTGTEDDLFSCGTSKWTTQLTSCDAQTIAAINCRPVTKIRLMNQRTEVKIPLNKNHSVTGRVEVYYDNDWGTICDDQFDGSDAQVLCNMLGIPFGKVYRESEKSPDYVHEPGTGNILIDDLSCLGIEKDISECRSREWGTHNCEHNEDVAITCYYKIIDPCSTTEHVRLPNLELRKVNTPHLPKPMNDSKLPFRWYNVGNNTMPVKAPPNDSCGTHLPIYSSYSTERLGANKTAEIKATQVGDNHETYDIEMKNCNNQFYVYKLRPTNNEQSGYCFGIGSTIDSAPTFVPDSLSTTPVTNEKGVSFLCKFNPSTKEDLHYQVKWRIEGSSQKTLTKQFFNASSLNGLRLTESDFEDNDIGLGVNITCALRAFVTPNGLPGPLSAFSKPLFFGIKVLTPFISLRKGETKSVELLNSVPIICYTEDNTFNQFIQSRCNVRLQYFSPEYGTCSSMPSFQEGCDTLLTNDEVGQMTRINISVAETGQYGVAGHFKIYLSVPAIELGYLKLWRKTYKLPVISVDVLPEIHTEWRGSICTARNDPHMYTFDQRTYEHHENGGEYVLYRHKFYTNVEIQHKVAPCTNGNDAAKCNCGVAVRAGRDVYVINVCDNLLDIGHKHCGDEALTVKKDTDFTYTIYLPFGTAVRARIDNQPYMGAEGGKVLDISILPSVHDHGGNSTGLCGTLNNNQDDDFQHRDEGIGTLKDRKTFIKSWKVLQNESLFTANVDMMTLERWVFPMCTCKEDEKGSPLSCDRSVSECTPGMRTGEHSCAEVSSRRSVRSLTKRPRIPLVRQTRHYETRHKIIKRESEAKTWNDATATDHCRNYFSALKAFQLCNKVPSTHTNVSEQNCVLDILLTNSSEWVDISRQSMLDACQSEIHRNASVRQEVVAKAKNATAEAEAGLHTGTTILPPSEIQEIEELEQTIKTIKEISCLNDCSGKGNCSNGTCVCKKGYGATDCSLDINRPPRLQEILDDGYCDEKDSDCTHIYVFGEVFVGTNLTCRLKKFTMAVNNTRVNAQTFHTKGTAETLIEAMCPIEHLRTSRRRRSDIVQPPVDFVHGYEVSVSNDGLNFGNKTLDVYVFDSTCQTYTNGSMGITFNLKGGYCHIEGNCVQNGTLSVKQTMICDTRADKFRWTMIPTTTQAPVTTNKASTVSEITKCDCNVNNTNSCVGTLCKCKTGWTGLNCEEDVDECETEPTVCDNTAHSGCQNAPGSYNCLCLRNFQKSDKGICEVYTETDPNATIAAIEKSEPDQTTFKIEITIGIPVSSMHNLNLTETYQEYLKETKNALKQYYQQKLGIGLKDVVIISLRQGSVIVQHAVIVKTEDYVIKELSVAIATLSRGEKIELFGTPYSIHNVKIEKSNVGIESDHFLEFIHCEIYTNLHPCEIHEQCVLEKGTPTCKRMAIHADNKTGTTNLMIIISSTVGSVLVIIIFALVVVICCKRKKQNRLENHQHMSVQNEYNDVNSREMVQIPRAKHYSDDKTVHDNPAYQHESRDSAMADTTLDSRLSPIDKEGSYCESKDGYVYYYGKK